MTTRALQRTVSGLVAMSLLLILPPPRVLAETSRAPSAPAETPRISWLAAGDSYSSGEGIRRTEGQCAQSSQAYAPRAAGLLRSQRGWDVGPFAFTACTGAITTDFFNHGNMEHPPQTRWAKTFTAGGRFDVVSLSFGGNDVDFAGVMRQCIGIGNDWHLGGGCQVDAAELERRIRRLVAGDGSSERTGPFGPDGRRTSLVDFYVAVAERHLKDRGVLLVVGYPRIFAPSDQWPEWRHGSCGAVTASEADMLGDAAEALDAALRTAVEGAGRRVRDVLDVQYLSRLDSFDNSGDSHSLCADGTSWMNGVSALWYAGRMSSPFHPNEVGHLVTAEEAAGRVEQWWLDTHAPEAVEPAEPSTEASPSSTPTVTDGSSRYEIGEPFEEVCSVAWPTAPTFTSSTIELTLQCLEVPGQYLFVHVSYPDPGLAITPSTGAIRVSGTIVDVATSAYGPKQLVVAAQAIDLNP